jgi:hypothetical protein
MTHQIYARLGSFLFFKILPKAYLFDPFVILNYEKIQISMIVSVLAREIIVAKKTTFKILLLGAVSIFTRWTPTIQAHGTLGTSKSL